jgi:hypothetical protein
MRASEPSLFRGLGSSIACSSSRFPARRTVLEPMSSSNTARRETSPPYSFARRSNENPFPPKTKVFGRPRRVRNLRSVSHPRTTLSEGIRLAKADSKPIDGRLSIRLISFRGNPVSAAIFEWLSFPFCSLARPAAARTNASRASLEKLFGVIPRGRSANASSPSRFCRSACVPSASLNLPLRRV